MARRGESRTRKITELIGRALSGGREPSAAVRDQVAELGGTRAVAQRVGRSERTVRRWAQSEHVPVRGGAGEAFQGSVQEHRNTPDYRQSQINPRRAARMRNNGSTFKFQGVAGPINDSTDSSVRRRNITWHLSGDAMDRIMNAYVSQGEQAGVDELGRSLADEYIGAAAFGWQFADDAQALQFLRHNF